MHYAFLLARLIIPAVFSVFFSLLFQFNFSNRLGGQEQGNLFVTSYHETEAQITKIIPPLMGN